jgi:hypothetical protein
MWMTCKLLFLAVLLVLAITLYFTHTFLGSSYMHLHYTVIMTSEQGRELFF